MNVSRRNALKIALSGAATLPFGKYAQAATTLKVVSLGSWDEKITSEGLIQPMKALAPALQLEIERLPFNQLLQALEVRLAARNADPDVYIVDGPLTASYASRGHLLQLDGLVDKAAIAPSAVEACSYKGSIYCAPLANTATVLYYNEELFKKANIAPPSADPANRWTWEKTYEAGKALANKSEGVWGFAWDQSERPYEMLPMGQSIGGTALSPDGLTASGFLDSKPFVDAWTFMQKFYADGVSPRGLFDIPIVWELFSTGKLAMMVGLTAGWDTFVKSKVEFGVAPMPYMSSGKPVSTTGGWTFGINPRSTNLEASKEFIRAIMNPQMQEKFLRVRPYAPFVSEMWTRMSDYYTGDMWKIVRHDYESTAISRPVTPGFREYEEVLRLALRDIQMGSDPKPTLAAAAQKVDRELQKYRTKPL
jgi:multiple sugar transport system substrate-binding protein